MLGIAPRTLGEVTAMRLWIIALTALAILAFTPATPHAQTAGSAAHHLVA